MQSQLPVPARFEELTRMAREIMAKLGLNGTAECGVLIDGSHSMADEYGLNSHCQPVFNSDNQVQHFVELWLALARVLDPNGVAQGVFFSETAKVGDPIQLDNVANWVDKNRLAAEDMGATDMTIGLQVMLSQIATETGIPQIAELAHFGNPEYHGQMPHDVIEGPRYILAIFTDGEPKDVAAVENILRAMSYTSIEVLIVYVSNQPVGLSVLETLTRIEGRRTDNVRLLNLGKHGLQDVSDEDLLSAFAQSLVTR
jgi:hypothetical protein